MHVRTPILIDYTFSSGTVCQHVSRTSVMTRSTFLFHMTLHVDKDLKASDLVSIDSLQSG